MVCCQAFGCSNRDERGNPGYGKSFFQIPDPTKHPEKADIAARWLHNMRTDWTVKTFRFGKSKKVCEDHFESTCFEENLEAEALGYKPRKKLKADSFPTIFSFAQPETSTGRAERAEKRQKLHVSNDLQHFQHLINF